MSSIVEAAKRKAEGALTAAKGAAEEAPAAVQKARENPEKAKNDFLHSPLMRAALPFINGGAAGMVATSVIQPIDMIKVRLQLAGEPCDERCRGSGPDRAARSEQQRQLRPYGS